MFQNGKWKFHTTRSQTAIMIVNLEEKNIKINISVKAQNINSVITNNKTQNLKGIIS